MFSFINSGYPENLKLLHEKEIGAFYQHQILEYPWNNPAKVIPALIAE